MTEPKLTIQLLNKTRKKDIQRFYKLNCYPASFIGYDHSYILAFDQKIMGAVIISYLSKNNHYALLHALLIAPSYRNKGYANLLIKKVMSEHSHIICFAERELESLYVNNGFNEAENSKLPYDLIKKYDSYVKKSKELTIFINNKELNNQ